MANNRRKATEPLGDSDGGTADGPNVAPPTGKQPATRTGHGTHTPGNPQGVKAEGLPRDEYPADAPDRAKLEPDSEDEGGVAIRY